MNNKKTKSSEENKIEKSNHEEAKVS